MNTAKSQYAKQLETDRPGESKSAFVQSFKSFQAEFGFRKTKEGSEEYVFRHPAFTLRYGLTNWLEARAEGDIRTKEQGHAKETGLNPVRVGLKALIMKGEGIVPHTSAMLQVGIPFLASKKFTPPHAAPELRLLFENEVNDQFNVNYNAGVEWDGEDTRPSYIYSLSPQVTVHDRWQLFVELYGFAHQHESAETSADAGLGYFVNDNIKVDVNTGWGLSNSAPDHFYAIGLSARIQ